MTQSALKRVEAEILYVIWKRKRRGDGSPMTVRDLHKALAGHDSQGHVEISDQTVKRAVQSLRSRPGAYLQAAQVGQEGPGKPPAGYKLAPGNIITRPATAMIVLALYNYPDHTPPDRQSLLEKLAERAPHNQGKSEVLDKEEIERQIAFCIAQGYLVEDRHSGRLSTTPRVDEELRFLAAIADEPDETDSGGDRG